MNELVHFGGRPIMYGRLTGVGAITGIGDLLAYRREWEPFILAHLALWRKVNSLFEDIPAAQSCPPGIARSPDALNKLSPSMQSLCYDIMTTRWAVSDTDPAGILPMWNAWAGKSDADILTGAESMLKWLQQVVTNVGGPYKDRLLDIAKRWNIPIDLPPVPSLSLQQQVIAQIEGAWISLKGVLQIVGYAAGEVLETAGTITQALAKGLTEAAKTLPKVIENLGSPWVWIGAAAVVAAVGAGLVIYYVPRQRAA
jgi:hypothetical protein